MIVLDTTGLLSAIDESQRYRAAYAEVFPEATPPRLLSPFVPQTGTKVRISQPTSSVPSANAGARRE